MGYVAESLEIQQSEAILNLPLLFGNSRFVVVFTSLSLDPTQSQINPAYTLSLIPLSFVLVSSKYLLVDVNTVEENKLEVMGKTRLQRAAPYRPEDKN